LAQDGVDLDVLPLESEFRRLDGLVGEALYSSQEIEGVNALGFPEVTDSPIDEVLNPLLDVRGPVLRAVLLEGSRIWGPGRELGRGGLAEARIEPLGRFEE
jgi:hypothetical protein